jgi:Na+/H+ antiporter NhaC
MRRFLVVARLRARLYFRTACPWAPRIVLPARITPEIRPASMIRSLRLLLLGFAVLVCAPQPGAAQGTAPAEVSAPGVVLTGTTFGLTVQRPEGAPPAGYVLRNAAGAELARGEAGGGESRIENVGVASAAELPLSLEIDGAALPVAPRAMPGWLSIVPPLVAIALALIFREVVISLFAGIWLGALILAGFDPITATMRSIDQFVVSALAKPDHVSIIVFSLLLGGMVGVITRSGGARGMVESLRRFATTRRRGQLIVGLSGLVIFFDDYANTLIRGNSLRPVTDQLRISREKLAYIVDSIAAPIAVTAFISTWVGFEISMIGSSLASAAEQAADPAVREQLLAGAANPYNVFLHSIPYLFYPILAIAMVFLVALTGREFGAMRRAEERALSGGGVFRPGAMLAGDTEGGLQEPPAGVTGRWYNLVIPVAAVIVVALAGLYYTGAQDLAAEERNLSAVIGAADPFASLLWASFAGVIVAITLAVSQRILNVVQAVEAWVGGMRAMLLAIVILALAWGLSGITEALGTGAFLAGTLQDTLPLVALPAIVFLIAAVTAFATGTSWGTMAILFPVVVPLAVQMGAGIGFAGGDNYTILLGAISSIMAGAVFGDHASPISDTTVISSMASGCDHIDHVRTQLPYALVVAVVALVIGEVPAALGLSPFIAIVVGIALLYGVLRIWGRVVEPIAGASLGTPDGAPGTAART